MNKFYTLDNQFIEETSKYPPNFTGIVVHNNGTKEWFFKGEWHRLDGPATEWADGSKFWYVEGKLHRLDGPAIEWQDGSKSWWIDDKQVTEEQCKLLQLIMKLKELL